MNRAKSWGLVTCNKNGNLEVSWEFEKTFFWKIFKARTEFIYEKKGNDWFDKSDNSLVVDFDTHYTIKSILINLN